MKNPVRVKDVPEQKLIAMLESGRSVSYCAKQFGVCREALGKRVRATLTNVRKNARDPKHKLAKETALRDISDSDLFRVNYAVHAGVNAKQLKDFYLYENQF